MVRALALAAPTVMATGVAILLAGCSAPMTQPRDFLTTCASGFVSAKKVASYLKDGEPSIAEPKILSQGDVPRIQCAYTDRKGYVGAYTLDVICKNPLEPSCHRIVAVFKPSGEALYQQ